jgi:hypothetical protein
VGKSSRSNARCPCDGVVDRSLIRCEHLRVLPPDLYPRLVERDAVVENVQGVMLNVGFGAFAVVGALLVIRRPTNTIGFTTTQTLFRTLTGQQQQPQLVVVVSTLAIAALFIHFVGASRRSSTGAFQEQVRRQEDTGSVLRHAARRDGPGRARRRTGGIGQGDDAAGARLALAASRISFEGSAGRLSGSPAEDRGVLHSLVTLRYL